MRTPRYWRASLSLGVFLAISAASAQDATLKLSGIYSNLQLNTESGDLRGIEIMIVPQPSAGGDVAWSAFVQLADGGAPYSDAVPLTVKENQDAITQNVNAYQLVFTFGGVHYTGLVTSKELQLCADKGHLEHLRRGKSYWEG
jgi:hypothetical protein